MFDNLWYLFAAYAVIWGATFGYLLYVSLLARGVRREVETLTEAIRDGSLNWDESAARPAEEDHAPPRFERLVGTEPPR